MSEPLGNIALLCPHHGAQLPQRCMDSEKKLYVKVKFPIRTGPKKGATENMWVWVASYEDHWGTLSNDPLFVSYVAPGDKVFFTEDTDGRMKFVSVEPKS